MDNITWVKDVEARFGRLRQGTAGRGRHENEQAERIALLEMQVELLSRALLGKGLVEREEVEQLLRRAEGVTDQGRRAASDLPAEPLDGTPAPEYSRWGRRRE